ncbi:MAG TPA: hypothetical protein ENG56_00170 [Candidatus Aenigmarchaeota archaeon]|nr:hypothetical protein [Candidatus Aenigmarchaeota archaeon]
MIFFRKKKTTGNPRGEQLAKQETLEEIVISLEEEKPEVTLENRGKAYLAASVLAAGAGIAEQYINKFGGVDITSSPWQGLLTAFLIGSNYWICRKILRDKESALAQTLLTTRSTACTLDFTSYLTSGFMHNGIPWNNVPPGTWAKNVFRGEVVDFLTDPIHEAIPLPRAYFLSHGIAALYFGVEKFAEKHPRVRNFKERVKKFGKKLYEFSTKSKKNKYLVGTGVSVAFGALSGNMYMAIPVLATLGVGDVLEHFRKNKEPKLKEYEA